MGLPFDGTFDIGCSINIVCLDGLRKMFQGEVCFGQKIYVDKVPSGTTVNEGSGFDDLSSSS